MLINSKLQRRKQGVRICQDESEGKKKDNVEGWGWQWGEEPLLNTGGTAFEMLDRGAQAFRKVMGSKQDWWAQGIGWV